MSPQVASVEASQLLRAERTTYLREQLKSGSFDAARYESTPRRRAERLAQVLNRVLSRGAMRRRLRKLGVASEFCGGTLLAVSVEGGGIDVRRADGKGQVVTGSGVDCQVLAIFPELVPFTLRNLFVTVAPPPQPSNYQPALGSTSVTSGLYSVSGSGVECWELTLFSSSYTATAATGRYSVTVNRAQPPSPPPSYQGHGSAAFTYGSIVFPRMASNFAGTVGLTLSPIVWGSDGLNWIQTHAEQFEPVVGSFSAESSGDTVTTGTFNLTSTCITLQITYTDTGCDTCDLTLQVNSACDGNIVDGGTFTLSNGMSCVQSGGTCTISGIPHGTYDWTWAKTGYQTQTGTYECECEGGSSTLSLEVVPDGGCPPNPEQVEVQVTDYCTEGDLSGVLIILDADTPDEVQCVTETAGVCYFENVAEGEHTLTVSKDDYQSQFQVVVKAGTQLVVTIALFPDGGCNPPECREAAAVGPMRSLRPVVRRRGDRIAVGPRRSLAPVVRAFHA